MTDYRLGIKNQPSVFYVYLPDMAGLPNFRVNPTLAAGDVVVFKDDVSNGNIATLPVVTPAGSRRVKIVLTADENNCDITTVELVDKTATKEWGDLAVVIANGLNRIDDLALASTALSTAVWTNAKAAYLDAAISSRSTLGSGANSTTITITDGSNPLDGVNVWVSTDIGGTNVVANGFTNTSGNVTFLLDAGTYYVWKQRANYQFSNPQTMTV